MGKVGNCPAKMLIDTGAAVTLVHQRLLNQNTYTLKPTGRKVTGVTGSTLELLGEADIELSINGLVTTHNCLIAAAMDHDVIIGYDLLKAEGYTLDFSEPGVNKRNHKQTAYLRLPGDLHLPAQTKKFVHITPTRRLDLCLEARVEPIKISTPGIWVEDAVSTITEEGKILVCIVNTNAWGVTLPRRTRVANTFSFQGTRINHIQVGDWLTECLRTQFPAETCHQVVEDPATEEKEIQRKAQRTQKARTILSIMDLSTLTVGQRKIIARLVHQHPGSFALEGEPLTATHLTQYHIPTGDARPVRKRPYRLPECHREPLRKLIETLEGEGVITPSRSEWCAPILLVPKGTSGTYRLVCDYRGLNKVLTRDAYPLPRIDDMLDNLRNAKHFSVLDMKSPSIKS